MTNREQRQLKKELCKLAHFNSYKLSAINEAERMDMQIDKKEQEQLVHNDKVVIDYLNGRSNLDIRGVINMLK